MLTPAFSKSFYLFILTYNVDLWVWSYRDLTQVPELQRARVILSRNVLYHFIIVTASSHQNHQRISPTARWIKPPIHSISQTFDSSLGCFENWNKSSCLRYSTQIQHDLDEWEPSSISEAKFLGEFLTESCLTLQSSGRKCIPQQIGLLQHWSLWHSSFGRTSVSKHLTSPCSLFYVSDLVPL